jgi:hypothetical protein
MFLFALPDEIVAQICSYLTEIDVRRLKRVSQNVRKILNRVYKPKREHLIIDDKRSVCVYVDLLLNYEWKRIEDQLGLFSPTTINGQSNHYRHHCSFADCWRSISFETAIRHRESLSCSHRQLSSIRSSTVIDSV